MEYHRHVTCAILSMQDNGLQHHIHPTTGCNDPSWSNAWDQVSKIAMVTLSLQGHEHLFKRHGYQGRKYMDAPHVSQAVPFRSLAQLFTMTKFTTSWKHRGATITEAMWDLKWEGDTDEKKIGARSSCACSLIRCL